MQWNTELDNQYPTTLKQISGCGLQIKMMHCKHFFSIVLLIVCSIYFFYIFSCGMYIVFCTDSTEIGLNNLDISPVILS